MVVIGIGVRVQESLGTLGNTGEMRCQFGATSKHMKLMSCFAFPCSLISPDEWRQKYSQEAPGTYASSHSWHTSAARLSTCLAIACIISGC